MPVPDSHAAIRTFLGQLLGEECLNKIKPDDLRNCTDTVLRTLNLQAQETVRHLMRLVGAELAGSAPGAIPQIADAIQRKREQTSDPDARELLALAKESLDKP